MNWILKLEQFVKKFTSRKISDEVKTIEKLPSREKINLFVGLGISLFVLGMIDLLLNSFFGFNVTSFLPRWINYFTPLIFCFLGLHYIRIDFSGNRTLDNLNKNLNSI